MRIIIIAIFLATTLFGFFLKYLTYSRRNAPLPENVKDVFDDAAYQKNQAYKMEKLKFSIVSGIIGMVISLSILLFNVHNLLYNFISGFSGNIYLVGLFIFIVPLLAINIIFQIISIYDTFVIEQRFGFNKSSVATFIIDFIKMLIISLIIASGLLTLFLFLHDRLGDRVFLAFFFVLIAFQFFMAFISPLLIRIIYKLTPLQDSELKEKIENLAKNTGYKLKGIYMVDASKRTAKMNAFASGFGKTKTIGLFDTLLEKMTHDEIIGILAHEIGHAKKRHVLKSIPFGFLTFAIMTAAAFFIVTMPEVSAAFGFSEVNTVFGIYILFIMLSPVSLILQIPSNAISRKHEYEADAFEREQVGKEAAVSAIKKLYREDLGNLTPHPFVVLMQHSHPPLSERVAALDKQHV